MYLVILKFRRGATITDLDLTYTRALNNPSTKVNATAGSNTAHSDNTAVYVDGTDAPELLKVDFPDAAFASGVDEVILTVYNPVDGWERELRVTLIDNTNKDIYDRLGSPNYTNVVGDIANLITRAKGLDEIHDDQAALVTTIGTPNNITIANDIQNLIDKTGGLDDIYTVVSGINGNLNALIIVIGVPNYGSIADDIANLIIRAKGLDEIHDDIAALNDVSSGDVQTSCDLAISANTDINNIDNGVNNIEAKLPTNFIMGSSVQTDKDDEIDAIKLKTDNLPHSIKKNTAIANFKFVMLSATTKDPLPGLTVTAERKLDAGGTWLSMAGAIVDDGEGVYSIAINAADTNGDTGTWKFTATGAETTLITFITEAT